VVYVGDAINSDSDTFQSIYVDFFVVPPRLRADKSNGSGWFNLTCQINRDLVSLISLSFSIVYKNVRWITRNLFSMIENMGERETDRHPHAVSLSFKKKKINK
jgi:hypothetical protein